MKLFFTIAKLILRLVKRIIESQCQLQNVLVPLANRSPGL